MQNTILKITRMGFALVILAFGALPALAQDCTGWEYNYESYWRIITPEKIKTCLDNGAGVNARGVHGLTPLHFISWWNTNPKTISVLIDAGANIHARSMSGSTPLHVAALGSKNSEIIIALLNAGADSKAKTEYGKIPFYYIKENEALKDTPAYWALHDAQF